MQAYLRDVANTEEWDAPTVSCEPLDPSTPVDVGKQRRNVSEFRGKRSEPRAPRRSPRRCSPPRPGRLGDDAGRSLQEALERLPVG